MSPSLYQSSWKHNRLIKDTAQLSKMGLGCGGCSHGLEAITACNRAACTPALGNTECQQLTPRTVHLPWCPVRSCPDSQEEAHTSSHPLSSQGRTGLSKLLSPEEWKIREANSLPSRLLMARPNKKVSTHLPSLAVSVKHNKAQTSHPAQQALSG